MKSKVCALVCALCLVLTLCIAGCGKSGGQEEAAGTAQAEPAAESAQAVTEETSSAAEGEESGKEAGEETGITMGSGQAEDVIYDYEVLEDGTVNLYGCDLPEGLTELEIPSELDGYEVSKIQSIIYDNDTIRKVIIPESVKIIGENCFTESPSLEEVEIRGVVTELEKNAFFNCTALKSLSFKEGLVKGVMGSVLGCTGLEELHVPASLTNDDGSLGGIFDIYLPENLTVYTPAGSDMEKIAKDAGVPVVNE